MFPKVMSIGGSDCSSGAGIQADLKTLSALGVYGQTVITSITAQNTHGIISSQAINANIVADQINCLLDDGGVNVIKISMVVNKNIIEAISHALQDVKDVPILIDPIISSTSGYSFLKPDAFDAFCNQLLPIADILMPNLVESAQLLNCKMAVNYIEMVAQAKALYSKFNCNILLKSGHLVGNKIHDIYYNGIEIEAFTSQKINAKNTHGTGCTYGSAIAANLAISIASNNSKNYVAAIIKSKSYMESCIKTADQLNIGTGTGGLYHFNNQPNWQSNIASNQQ